MTLSRSYKQDGSPPSPQPPLGTNPAPPPPHGLCGSGWRALRGSRRPLTTSPLAADMKGPAEGGACTELPGGPSQYHLMAKAAPLSRRGRRYDPKETPSGEGTCEGGAEIQVLVLLFREVSESSRLGRGGLSPAREGTQKRRKCLSWFQSSFSQRAGDSVLGSKTLERT